MLAFSRSKRKFLTAIQWQIDDSPYAAALFCNRTLLQPVWSGFAGVRGTVAVC